MTRLEACRNVWDLTQQMLQAARDQRWDDLPALEAQRQTYLQVLQDARLVPTTAEAPLIRQTLEAQGELLERLQTQRSALAQFINGRELGRSMTRAYGQLAGMGE